MRKHIIYLLLFSGTLLSQKNNFYTEFGGAGYLFTVNYERMLTKNILSRIGYGSNKGENRNDGSIKNDIRFYPIGLSYLLNPENKNIEIGAGTTILNGTLVMNSEVLDSKTKMYYIAGGIQNNSEEIGLLLKLRIYYLFLGEFSAPWAGISFGWSF